MGRIVQLDERLANMIAAGEVVERPSSVVKELVENSIDAKATRITIELIDSGVKSITVTDDGVGMSREDAKLCFGRHATSKIKNEYDLFRIKTLGFRGEAVPSIASVSTFTLLTSDGTDYTKIVYKGGHLEECIDFACKKGTKIKVENLFYNVPARLKYLKSLPQELSSITFLVSKFILANPNVSFILTNNGKTIYQTPGNGDLVRIFGELYGLEVAKNLLSDSYEGKGFKINLYLAKSIVSRANKLEITTIVNNRYVKSNVINEAIISGYHTYIPEGRYPVALIDITIDPLLIDVNVHPTKMQIKISNEDEMAHGILDLTKSLLKSASMIPSVTEEVVHEDIKAYKKENIFDTILKENEDTNPRISSDINITNLSVNDVEVKAASNKLLELLNSAKQNDEKLSQASVEPVVNADELKKTSNEAIEDKKDYLPYLEYCGQVHGTYLIFQNEEGMYLMDQHAAAERINYEYYLDVLSHPIKASQPLLIPLNLEFTSSEMILIEEHLEEFANLGFIITLASNTSYFIREVPLWLHTNDSEDFIRNILYNLSRDKHFTIEKYRDRIAAEIACKASIKANHAITKDEIDTLVKNLRKCKNPYTCPHGRPTIVKFTTLELEKMFMRVV